MSLQTAMKVFTYIGSFFLATQRIILGPVLTVCTALAALVKVFTSLGAVFNWIAGKRRPSDSTPHHDPGPERPGTDISVVGQDSPGYSRYVQTTGVEADDASDVREMLHGVRRLNTVGITNGNGGTVTTTGIRLVSRAGREIDCCPHT
ncbi:uncharacterized protein [Haliotis asinina]